MQDNYIYRKKDKVSPDLWLKRGVWLYFFLLIFEGALRKWVLPGLSTPLLIVRDPVAIWLIYKLWNRGLMPSSPILTGMIWIGILSIFTALFLGHGNLFVALFGARILLIHFPLIFVIGRIFDREDVLEMGRVLLWISIPMAVLIAMQFYSPQSAWVNRGIGGDVEGGGFSGALGFFRPPATFSFTNGTHLFFGLTASFLFYFWMNPKGINKLMLYGSTIGLVAAIPLSISRSLTFFIVVAFVFLLVSVIRKPENILRIVFAVIGFALILTVLSKVSYFQTASDAFLSRFTSANNNEGGLEGTIGDRYFGGMSSALANSTEQPFFGYGTGMGSNVGSMLLTGGHRFLISEEEWGRVIGETGAVMGLAVILLRLILSFKFLSLAYKKMVNGDMLPWMMASFALLVIPQGQWAQPTSLGFATLIGGLLFASMRKTAKPELLEEEEDQEENNEEEFNKVLTS